MERDLKYLSIGVAILIMSSLIYHLAELDEPDWTTVPEIKTNQ